MNELQQHLATLGPLAILLGAAIEGQTVVIAGGVLARQQLISPVVAVLAAALGSGILDHLLFVLGRSFRSSGFVRRAAAKKAFSKALYMIERHPIVFILSFRFLYGLRAAGPVAVGVCEISATRFAILNALGAVIWAGFFVTLGYLFGPAVMAVLGALIPHAAPIGIAVALLVLTGLIVWRWRVWATQERA